MKERLQNILENVVDTYPDFVIGVVSGLKNVSNGYESMIEYIESTPEVTISMICSKLSELRGIKRNSIQ